MDHWLIAIAIASAFLQMVADRTIIAAVIKRVQQLQISQSHHAVLHPFLARPQQVAPPQHASQPPSMTH
jgi:hypothetical protein